MIEKHNLTHAILGENYPFVPCEIILLNAKKGHPKKMCFFIIGDWNAKVDSQETPGVTGKFGLGVQNEAGQRLIVLPREQIDHSKHPLPITQEKTLHMDITDAQHRKQINYILCSQRWRSSIQSAKTRPGADCGSDHELLIAKFRLKLKKVGETTRPFRYDLNKIPYDYTVEGRNRFKGLDLIGRVHVCSVCPTL